MPFTSRRRIWPGTSGFPGTPRGGGRGSPRAGRHPALRRSEVPWCTHLYAEQIGAFQDLGAIGELFQHQAAMAIDYAREIDNLNEAVRTRSMIGTAVGIVMERYHLTDDRAFAFLTRLSQDGNVKLREVARRLIAATRG